MNNLAVMLQRRGDWLGAREVYQRMAETGDRGRLRTVAEDPATAPQVAALWRELGEPERAEAILRGRGRLGQA